MSETKKEICCKSCDLIDLCNYKSIVEEIEQYLPINDKVFVACKYKQIAFLR